MPRTKEVPDSYNDLALVITRDQATFLLNLVEKRHLKILKKLHTRRQESVFELPAGETDQLYADKTMCRELSNLFDI